MTLPEERGLSLSISDLENGIDPVFLTMVLHKERLLPEAIHKVVSCMSQQGFKRRRICEYLFTQIPSYVSLENFVSVLDKCGYASLSALVLVNSYKWNSAYMCSPKPTDGSSRAYGLYSNIKRLINNAQLENSGLFLRKMADRCYSEMEREIDPLRKQKLADNCVAIISAETDIIAITFDRSLCRHVLFTQLERLRRQTSNTLISDLGFYGRLANAYAIAGEYDMCEQMLDEAKCKAYITGPCIEFVILIYMIVYVILWEFEVFPTHVNRSKLLTWCRVGLKCVEEDFVANKNHLKRILMLRMALCLLGLGNRTTVIENCPVDEVCIAEAKLILANFDQYWDGIETRREMIYNVARARLCELEKFPIDALKYLSLAHKLAKKGKFKEKVYIKTYYKTIFCRESCLRYQIQPCSTYFDQNTRNSRGHNFANVCKRSRTETCEGVYREMKIQRNANTADIVTSQRAIQSSVQSQNKLQYVQGQNTFCQVNSKCMQKENHVDAAAEFWPFSLERSPPSGDSNPD